MIFTKQQRNEIYKKTLQCFINKQYNENRGLCYSLKWTIYETFHKYLNYIKLEEELIEFSGQKPKNFSNKYYWFELNENGLQKRIDVLKKCIELTK